MTAMKTHTRMLRSLNLGSDPHRRWVGECQAGAARLVRAEGAGNALNKAYCALAVVLTLSSSLVHALSPTCAAPGRNSVTSGAGDNTAMGTGTLISNTTGNTTTAAGSNALQSTPTGNGNPASGVDALYLNTTGYGNTASGVGALFANTTGIYNTASGVDALFSNTTGGDNTAPGTRALH